MNVEELKKYQAILEKRYMEVERQIDELDDSKENETTIKKLERVQDKIDDQLDLLDDIIDGIYEVPKKYNKFLELKKEYESLIGE